MDRSLLKPKQLQFDERTVPSPCFVVDERVLLDNLRILESVRNRAGCKIILALKAFAMFKLFPIMREFLDGTSASSLNEARLGRDEFDGEVHVYAPAYRDDEFDALLNLADHITFNSFSQWEHFKPRIGNRTPGRRSSVQEIKCSIRINPEHSEVTTELYDPCARFSRLRVTASQLKEVSLTGINGLHFHTLCELNVDALERTLVAVEQKFESALHHVALVNFGGGHHITRADYDVDRLCELVMNFRKRYGVEVIIEPGEAVALNAGVLVTSVLDIVDNEMPIAILDASAAAHMPDVLEMPYNPEIAGAGKPGEYSYTYRVGGISCLAGDVIGDYSFSEPLERGQKLVFLDMAHYSMVKTNTFNGINLPAIAIIESRSRKTKIIKKFGYEDYRQRLS